MPSMPPMSFANVASLYKRGQVGEAINLCKIYIQQNPKDGQGYHLLGHALWRSGQDKQAQKTIKNGLKAVKSPKDVAMLWDILGLVSEQHNPKDAIKHYKKAILADKDNPNYIWNLAKLYEKIGETENAKQTYKKGLLLAPQHLEAHNALGLLAADEEDYEVAETYFTKATELDDNYHPAWHNLSHIKLEYPDSAEEAISCSEKSLSLKGESVPYRMTLAKHFGALGQADKATEHYLQAAELDDGQYIGDIYFSVARYQGDEKTLESIEAWLKKPIHDKQKALLIFAKAKIYEARCDYDTAEDYYLEANGMLHDAAVVQNYFTHMRKEIANLKQIFADVDLSTPHDRSGDAIFILGTMRCGSSLLEQILSCHTDISAAGEINHLSRVLGQIANPQKLKPEEKIAIADNYKKRLRYFTRHKTPPPTYITDKQLDNFFNIGWIRTLLPQGKIIHCMRNRNDAALSIFCNRFTSVAHPYAYDIDALASFFALHEDLMAFWHDKCGDNLYRLNYEDLVASPQAVLQGLSDFLSVPMQEGMLDFAGSSRPVQTASSAQVRNSIYNDSVGKMARFPKIQKIWEKCQKI